MGNAREVKRVNLNVPVETLERIDEYADSMTISRTAAILVLVNNALDSKKTMSDMSRLVELFKSEGIINN